MKQHVQCVQPDVVHEKHEIPLVKSKLKISNIKFIWVPNSADARFYGGAGGTGILTFDIISNDSMPKQLRFKLSGFISIGMFMIKTRAKLSECEQPEYEEDNFFFRPDMVASQLSEYMIASVLMSLIRFPVIEHIVSVSIPDIEVPQFNGQGEPLNIDIYNFHQQSYDRMHDVFFKITSGVSVADGEILVVDELFLKEEGLDI